MAHTFTIESDDTVTITSSGRIDYPTTSGYILYSGTSWKIDVKCNICRKEMKADFLGYICCPNHPRYLKAKNKI